MATNLVGKVSFLFSRTKRLSFPVTKSSFCKQAHRRSRVAIVFGAGEATGAACTKAFAVEGYTVIAVRRDKGATLGNIKGLESRLNDELNKNSTSEIRVHGYSADARNESEVHACKEEVSFQALYKANWCQHI